MTTVLYNLIIRPLYLAFELIFSKAFLLTGNYGITIICLSLAVNFLILPLYNRADAIQEEEREKEKKLSYWVDHIKKTFKGDERYMMLTTYYRQNDYKQTDSLKSTISLLLQIPFFIAAYRFLSGLEQLHGVSFGPIRDLGAQDAMLSVAGITVNVLPILMSVINILSGMVYGRDLSLKNKIQMYGIAVVFLVLLYRSPAGLVFYWTLNNVFSLVKNLIKKSKYKDQLISGAAVGGAVLLLLIFFVLHPVNTLRRKLFVICLSAVLLVFAIARLRSSNNSLLNRVPDKKPSIWLFIWPTVFLTILLGMVIPSSVVSSSPSEFIDQTNYQNPLVFVNYTMILAAGFFLVWFTVFYKMAANRGKQIIVCLLFSICGISIADYMFFGKNLGILSSELKYNEEPIFSASQQLGNMALVILLFFGLFFLAGKLGRKLTGLYLAMIAGAVVLFAGNVRVTQKTLGGMENYLKENITVQAEIPLTRTGQNVIVLMMDRSVNAYIPYLFQEKPELEEQFAGFTYYPNTVSMGTSTNTGSTALFGGYEYSPYEMNLRPDELLKDKHDEGLKVLPVLFSENGFTSSVYDPPYAGYTWIPDLSIYDDYPEINAYHTIGKFDPEIKAERKNLLQRNFFYYSVFKVTPIAFQKMIYDKGNYNNMADTVRDYTQEFIDNYTVLTNLPNITQISDDDKPTFMIMENKTMHEPCELQLPEYIPVAHVNNGTYDKDHADRFIYEGHEMLVDTDWRRIHYYAAMAAMQELGKWFDYLRENGVYDNSRIIIVSDHGYGLGQFDYMFTEENFDTEWFDPILMVKEFGSTEYTVSDQFMTNADVPILAMDGLIDNPINPFTGKVIDGHEKESDLILFHSTRWGVNDNNGYVFKDDEKNRWFRLTGDRTDMKNWVLIEDPTKQAQ